MHAEFLALRLIHILSAITWLGSGIFTFFFLVPALSSSPPVMGQVIAGLQKRRLFLILEIAAGLTILSGIRLLWIDSAGFNDSFMATGMGRTLSIGGSAAIIAAIFSFGVSQPARLKAGRIGASLATSTDAAERARLALQLDRLRKRAVVGSALAVGFGLLAASAMAIARYV